MILLVGYYDYPYGYGAKEFDGEKLLPVELSDFEFKVLEACDTASYDKDYIDFEWLKDWCSYREGSYEEYLGVIEKLFAKYDQIIICDDGCYNLLKIDLGENKQ